MSTVLPKAPNKDLRVKMIKEVEKLNVDLHKFNIYTVHRLTNSRKAPTIVVKINNRDKKKLKISRKEENMS